MSLGMRTMVIPDSTADRCVMLGKLLTFLEGGATILHGDVGL